VIEKKKFHYMLIAPKPPGCSGNQTRFLISLFVLHFNRSIQSPLASTARSGLHLIWSHRVQHDLVGSLLGIGRVTLAPIVAYSVSKDITIATESSARDRTANRWVTLKTVLRILVPEVECTVTTSRTESSMNGVEIDRVDRVNVADITVGGRSFTMTLERKVGGRVLLLNILNSTSSFNTTNSETRSISKAADYPRLPLEGGLHSLVEFRWVIEVNDIDVTIRSPDNKQFILDIHCVNAVLTINLRNRVRLPEIPVFDRLIPRTRHEKRRSTGRGVGNHMAASNRRIVRGDLYGGCSTSTKIKHSSSLIRASTNDLRTILEKTRID